MWLPSLVGDVLLKYAWGFIEILFAVAILFVHPGVAWPIYPHSAVLYHENLAITNWNESISWNFSQGIKIPWNSIWCQRKGPWYHETFSFGMGFHGIPWNMSAPIFMTLKGPWNSMEPPFLLKTFHGIPRKSMELLSSSTDLRGIPWDSEILILMYFVILELYFLYILWYRVFIFQPIHLWLKESDMHVLLRSTATKLWHSITKGDLFNTFYTVFVWCGESVYKLCW